MVDFGICLVGQVAGRTWCLTASVLHEERANNINSVGWADMHSYENGKGAMGKKEGF